MNAPDIRSEVRRIIWTLLIFGAVMSLAGNVVHAFMEHGWSLRLVGPVVAAAIPPVALLGLMHLMGAWSRWTGSDGISYWVFLIGVVALGAAAFRLSFATLRDLAESYGYSRFDASLFPLILDGLMALMTWGLVAATRPKVAHHLSAETANVVQGPVDQHAEPVHVPVTTVPMSTPRPVTTPSVTAQLTAPDAQLPTAADEVITAPIPTAQQGEQQLVTCDDTADDHPAEPATHQNAQVIPMVSKAGQQEAVTGEQVVGDEQSPTAQPAPAQVVRTAQLPTTEVADEQLAGEQQIDPAQEAAVLRERGSSRLAEEDLTDLIARIARGESYSAIAEATGISRNTVRKVAAMVPTEPEPVPVA
ncbi:DUF2637 domain-containing protein [Mycobacteroides abscessus]|uniref:DUF2637 domain-containing protein n=1 Tax=Mycobacteroides abscessus TaxID=36809 RepID=UPI0005DBC0CE|nr:DUF2637 domain-containing protein [Mycobacteroides abscessus]CPR70121.1 Protein of uncharacterised function (DUF2637) [Mycobacteroides abscessus]CPU70425.1 Protein of uncharacterised function (DUF2637) [Mycobacteroides abscessus]